MALVSIVIAIVIHIYVTCTYVTVYFDETHQDGYHLMSNFLRMV